MKGTRSLLIITICLLIAKTSWCTSDTVQYRMIVGTLGDSTRVLYEIGSFGLMQGGNIRYLKFVGLQTPTDYFRTENFGVTGSQDSLLFMGFASFDNGDYDRGSDADSGSIEFMEYLSGLNEKYESFFVYPDTHYFASASTIMFVLELRKKSDNSLVAILDTTKCYANGAGAIVYRNYPPSLTTRVSDIPGVLAGDTLYLKVNILPSLPNSGDFIGYDYQHTPNNSAANRNSDLGFLHQVYVPIAQPIIAGVSDTPTEDEIYATTTVPIEVGVGGRFEITVNARRSGSGRIAIYATNGSKVHVQDVGTISTGTNLVHVKLPSLSTGKYFIDFVSNGKTQSRSQFILVK